MEFRLPTGEDQEALAEHLEDATCVEPLRRCIVRMPTTWDLQKIRPAIEKRMEELTPRPVLEVEGVCPECGLQFSSTLDLSELVLAEAVEQSKRLPYDVHRLAWHYHWPEGEILSLPRKKRFRYLHLLEDELERMNLTCRNMATFLSHLLRAGGRPVSHKMGYCVAPPRHPAHQASRDSLLSLGRNLRPRIHGPHPRKSWQRLPG